MSLNKNTLLQRAQNLSIHIQENVNIRLSLDHKTIPGNSHTLAILDAFSIPKTFEKGVRQLESCMKGTQTWAKIVHHIRELYHHGILKNAEQVKPVLFSHPGRFDASSVHIRMLNDRCRTASYQQAIRETVGPKDIVLDVGTGTGILAVTAAMAGAKHVYAIERTGIAKIARELILSNSLADRVTLIEGQSTDIELPEKADVMVSEIIGNDPLQEGILPTTADAIKRLLKPNARLIPQRLKIYGLPVCVPKEKLKINIFTEESVACWNDWYGIDFSPLIQTTQEQDHTFKINTYHAREWLTLSDPVLLADFDLSIPYHSIPQSTLDVQAKSAGILNGVMVYFSVDLSKTVSLSIHPEKASSENSWASVVYIFGKPIPLKRGDMFKLNYQYTRQANSCFKVQKI